MGSEVPRQYVPLTCHGHMRPVPHIEFSPLEKKDDNYYLISACKDGNPMLRDGQLGDWIGTFIGHKGAVWQVRFSPDALHAATASADFTAIIWATHTGEILYTIQHSHIVRAIAYAPDSSELIATGGHEKKLRIFDIADFANAPPASPLPSPPPPVTVQASTGFEIGEGTHTGFIKSIVWTMHPNVIVTASENTLRWFDVPTRKLFREETLDGEIRTCELVSLAPEYSSETDIGGGLPVLAVSAGKCLYFWGGVRATEEIKRFRMDFNIASVGIDLKTGKMVVGEDPPNTWAKVCRWEDGDEIDVHKGHHGPIWSVAFSPDGKIYATASEDGTIKMWKNCEGDYGLWRGGANASERATSGE